MFSLQQQQQRQQQRQQRQRPFFRLAQAEEALSEATAMRQKETAEFQTSSEEQKATIVPGQAEKPRICILGGEKASKFDW